MQTLESVNAEIEHIILVISGNMTKDAKFELKTNESNISKYIC